KNPRNNCWKPRFGVRVTPVYTLLDETDLTNSYDRCNLIFGPWLYGGAYNDPWFTRSEMVGLRAGVYTTQEFSGAGSLAYLTDDRNIVAVVDGLWDNWPFCHTQVGFVAERSLTKSNDTGNYSYGVLYNRYVFTYGDSLYLPPIHYVEVFGSVQDDV